eukprot:13882509-Alexandrium_andersonii.AAC.1
MSVTSRTAPRPRQRPNVQPNRPHVQGLVVRNIHKTGLSAPGRTINACSSMHLGTSATFTHGA